MKDFLIGVLVLIPLFYGISVLHYAMRPGGFIFRYYMRRDLDNHDV